MIFDKNFFEPVFELAPDATLIVDAEGKIQKVNEQTRRLFQYKKGELIGKSVEILIPKRFVAHHGDNVKGYIHNPVARKMGSGMDLFAIDKLGKEFPVDISLNYLEFGDQKLVLLSVRDISIAKEIQNKLAQSEKRLNEAQELSNIGSWELDIENNVLYWSDQVYRILEIEKSEHPASNEFFFSFVHPDDREELEITYKNHLIHHLPYDIVHRFQLPNNKIKYVRERAETFFDEFGKPYRTFGTVTDITDIKEIEYDLRQSIHKVESSNKELEQFTFIASHDLQEPLKTLTSFVELLVNDPSVKNNKDLHDYSRFIKEASSRMENLVRGLLEYARISKNFSREEVNCGLLIHEVLSSLEALITDTSARVMVSEMPTIRANPLLLAQLFQHLVSNAIKYRRADMIPEIHIQATKVKSEWLFEFADNGIGISEEYYHKIFIIFQRLHNRSEYEGTGIGLSHCKKIVEMHGGKIWVESEENKGSTFYFTLPE
ncbi:MAG: ATP-binding protein [Cyclobacteriaceae bacterium]|nr:ATP-binding protein [Cyclobacteriaceae bacterium]